MNSSRSTRTSVRTSKPGHQQYHQQYHHQQQQQHHQQQHHHQQQQQHLNRNFVSGGSVQPQSKPVVSYVSGQAAAKAPAPAAAAPPAAQQPPPPGMKDHDGDVTMAAADAASDLSAEELKAQKKKFFQEMKKVTGVRKKPSKQMVQRRLRKHLTPKNATMALQEACPGASYQFTVMPGSAPPLFTAEVEVGGKKYHGIGSNKGLARAAAAERALQSLVKPQTKTTDEQGKETVEDTTPWSALAGFALHKLFCDWRQGRVGAPLSVDTAGPAAEGNGAAEAAGGVKTDVTPAETFTVPTKVKSTGEGKKPKPAKQLPTDAASRQPVQLLHEMRPSVAYEVVEHVMPQAGGIQPSITVAINVDGQSFKAKASNKKLAKKAVAKAAMTAIFGVQYPADME